MHYLNRPEDKTFDTRFSHRAPRPERGALGALANPRLVLIRGLPGSGKSTMARVLALVGYEHVEADMFFLVDGRYRYDASRIRDAHVWCQSRTREVLLNSGRVVVSNTFTRICELQPYLAMAPEVRVLEAQGRWQNAHGVPPETLQRMADRWEPLPAHLAQQHSTLVA